MKIREELLREKEQIIVLLEQNLRNEAIATVMSITLKQLYEKMMAYKIQNKEFWIS